MSLVHLRSSPAHGPSTLLGWSAAAESPQCTTLWDNWVACSDLKFLCDPSLLSLSDYVVGFGGKFGVQTDRQDKSALGWDHQEKLQLHESQKGTGPGFHSCSTNVGLFPVEPQLTSSALMFGSGFGSVTTSSVCG